jgi:hypothetical protein
MTVLSRGTTPLGLDVPEDPARLAKLVGPARSGLLAR